MQVFDFDNTIYKGESFVDFYFYSLKRKKELIKYVPLVGYVAFLYKVCYLSLDEVKKIVNSVASDFLQYNELANEYINNFWLTYNKKLKSDFLKMISPCDVIISASPRIFLEGVKDYINTDNFICSEYDLENGKLDFFCFKENKAKAFQNKYPDIIIDDLYIDSKNDESLIKLAKNVHFIGKK